jgi:hypothetical protein
MKEYPQLRHINCEDNRCNVCLEDGEELMRFLEKEIGQGNIDYLGEYRYWLDNIKKVEGVETEFGWFSQKVYDKNLIDEFITHKKSN